jgi:hypothetical protein
MKASATRAESARGAARPPGPSATNSAHTLSQLRPALSLRIEKLVLDGFPPDHRLQIGRAVEKELTHLFVTNGVPRSLTNLHQSEHLAGESFGMTPNQQPAAVGARVAWAVYRTLTR